MSEVPRASDQHHTPFSGCRWESAEHHRRNGGGAAHRRWGVGRGLRSGVRHAMDHRGGKGQTGGPDCAPYLMLWP